MKKKKTNKHCRLGIYLLLCLFVLSPSSSAQFTIATQSESFSDYCTELLYAIELEKTESTSQEDLILEIQFTDPVNYISNTLGLEPLDIDPQFLRFSISDLSDCSIVSGSLTIIPECFDIFTTITAAFSLKSGGECISESLQETVIKNPFIDLQFSDYTYDAERETLTKNITLFNAGSIDISSFYILPTADQDFASLTSASLGTVTNDTLFVEESDLSNGNFLTGNELMVELTYTIIQCDIRSINYEIGYRCESSNCRTTQLFVDENDIYQNDVQGVLEGESSNFFKRLNFGICEAPRNTITFTNSIFQQETSIGDIFNVGYIIEIENRFTRRFNECISLTAFIEGQPATVTRENESTYVVSFDNITTDPDGTGGIDDLDGDEQYDDIPLGDSINFELALLLNDACYENYENLLSEVTLIPTFSNYCQLMTSERSRANQEFTALSDHFSVSFPPASEFKIDQSNRRFLNTGENITTTIRVRPSANVSEQCNSDELILTVDVPTKLEYDNTKEIIYYNNKDTVVLIPNILNDTLLEFTFTELDSSQTFVDISFIAVCDIDTDTNFDSSIPVCDQCVEYNTENIRAELSKPCNLNCPATALSRSSLSAPFYTLCEDVPELEEPFVLEGANFFNLSSGYNDKEKTIRRDPFLNPSSINNRYFFDGDTMLVQIPFYFNCTDELQNFSVILTENQLRFTEFNIIESEIILLDSNGSSELGRCSADIFLNQSDTQISYSFSQNSFNLPCIDQVSDHILEIKIKFTRECDEGAPCGLVSSGTLRTSTDITLQSDCSKRVFYDTDTLFINEIFKEESFTPIEINFGLSTEIFDSIPISFSLLDNFFSIEDAIPEFKDIPLLREINYSIPEGYELVSDLLLVETSFLSDGSFIFQDDNSGDTLLMMPPTLIQNADGSTEYQFKNIPTDYSQGSILSPITGGVILKSVCQPANSIQEISVSGVIEYVNFADDSRDRIVFPFSENFPLIFLPEQFNVVDDFQIIDSEGEAEWTYTKRPSLFTGFDFGSNSFSPEQEYRFRYRSGGMVVDSITSFSNESFDFENNNKISVINTYVGDSIIDLTLLPEIIILDNGDTLLSELNISSLVIHTSQHDCGFDTLFFDLGRKTQFLQDSCSFTPYSDFFVSFSPPGFPQVEFTNVPQDIKTFAPNQFEFTLSNIAQGDLIENAVFIEGLPEGNFELFLRDENDLINVSETLGPLNDELFINLSAINKQILPGLSGLNISTLEFILMAEDLCVESSFLSLSIRTQSLSFCGDVIFSPIAKTRQLPFVAEEDIKFDLSLSSLTNNNCLDTASINIKIKPNQSQQVVSPIIELVVPDDLLLHANTVRLNGQLISDPITKPTDDDFSKVFIIQDGLPDDISDSISIDISFDGQCIDLCRTDEISAFFLSELEVSCIANGSFQQSVTRAFVIDQPVKWKSDLLFDNVESFLVGSSGDIVVLEINGSLSSIDNIPPQGDLILYPFADENLNQQFDEGEKVFDSVTISLDGNTSTTIAIRDSIEVPSDYLCSLYLTTAIDDSCACESSTVSIKQNGDLTLIRTIQSCQADAFEIELQYVESCDFNIEPNNNILNSADGVLTYQADPLVTTDTINVFSNCIGCQITERVIILNDPPVVKLELAASSDCVQSAQVTFNGSSIIPEQFDIEWSTGQTTQRIENVLNGDLSVSLTDQATCQYSDAIVIDNISNLDYQLDIISGTCAGDIPNSAEIVVSNDPTVSVLWNDGSQDLSRPDLPPGDYQFTLTNDLGCMQVDSLSFDTSGNLDFDIAVTNGNCNTGISGKLDIASDDPNLQFSVDGISFSDQRSFDSLQAGPIVVFAQNVQGCVDSITTTIQLEDTFVSGLPSVITGRLNQELVINPDPIQEEDIQWAWRSDDFDLSCEDCPSPSVFVDSEGTVEVNLTNGVCTIQEIIRISISLGNDIYIPDAFYPNSTSGNSLFMVYPNATFDELDMSIFDRWGNLVFDLKNAPVDNVSELGWDGRFNGQESMAGVYVFKAIVRRVVDDTELEILGDFILLR